ncbi:hypothetical protein SDC9_154814 [bioreactor metagenome]|uniref:Uncharacterized protein n=1 Tax=bioreactor metagenome TaxID=1076179 RepID=A0A645F4K6_9ZZZZ
MTNKTKKIIKIFYKNYRCVVCIFIDFYYFGFVESEL